MAQEAHDLGPRRIEPDEMASSPGDLDSSADVKWYVSIDPMRKPAWNHRTLICGASNTNSCITTHDDSGGLMTTEDWKRDVTSSPSGDPDSSVDVM